MKKLFIILLIIVPVIGKGQVIDTTLFTIGNPYELILSMDDANTIYDDSDGAVIKISATNDTTIYDTMRAIRMLMNYLNYKDSIMSITNKKVQLQNYIIRYIMYNRLIPQHDINDIYKSIRNEAYFRKPLYH